VKRLITTAISIFIAFMTVYFAEFLYRRYGFHVAHTIIFIIVFLHLLNKLEEKS